MKFVVLLILLMAQALAEDALVRSFDRRFELVRERVSGRVTAIRLKNGVSKISILPFLQMLKKEILKGKAEYVEGKAEDFLRELGDTKEARSVKKALKKAGDIERVLSELEKVKNWDKIERRLNKEVEYSNPTYLANLEDPSYFYDRQLVHELGHAVSGILQDVFLDLPLLSAATYVVGHVRSMMREQRNFHHNMLLAYFELLSPEDLGMTPDEVNRAISSIYEYRIDIFRPARSARARADWGHFGRRSFEKTMGRSEKKLAKLAGGERLNFAFGLKEGKVYHLLKGPLMLSSKPALALDLTDQEKVRTQRSVLTFAGFSIGLIPMPVPLVKDAILEFLESTYIPQVRLEGALVCHFEHLRDEESVHRIYRQSMNPYLSE